MLSIYLYLLKVIEVNNTFETLKDDKNIKKRFELKSPSQPVFK